MTTEQRVMESVLTELRKISRILTLIVTKDMAQREKILLLSAIGLQPKEIGELIGTSANSVSVTLSSMRRQRRKGAERESEA